MKKVGLSIALSAAIAIVMAAMPSEAATKKKAKVAKPAPVAKSEPVMIGAFNGCVRTFQPLAVVGAVGCGVFYAVPVGIEAFLAPRRS